MTGHNNGIAEHTFCIGSGKERLSDETKLHGVVDVVARLVSLERTAFISIIENFLGGSLGVVVTSRSSVGRT